MLDPVTSADARESLYKRLGGYDAIAAFVADLMPRLYNDPTLWVYWKGKSVDSRRRGEQLLIDFLCAAFEGPVFYAGPDMKSVASGARDHACRNGRSSLLISPPPSMRSGCPNLNRADFMAATESLKWDIVEEPSPAQPRMMTPVRAPGPASRPIRSHPPTPAAGTEASRSTRFSRPLSDPIRRGIIERLAHGPCSVTQLGAPSRCLGAGDLEASRRARALRADCPVESRPRALLPARRGAARGCRCLDRAASGILEPPARRARRLSGQGG